MAGRVWYLILRIKYIKYKYQVLDALDTQYQAQVSSTKHILP